MNVQNKARKEHARQILIWCLLQPLHQLGIYTTDMHPWCRPVRARTGPTVLTVSLQLVSPQKDLASALKTGPAMEAYVAAAMNLDPGERLPIRVSATGAFLQVEVPLPADNRHCPTYTELAKYAADGGVLVGLDMYNRPVAISLKAEMPGLLVTGRSGSGKTNFIRFATAQALAQGWRLFLVDLKGGRDWGDMRDLAERVATTEADARKLFSDLVALMVARNSEQQPVDSWVLLVVDEVSVLELSQQKPLVRLVKEGRSAGIRTIVGNQRAGTEIHNQIRANLTSRVAGLAANAIESNLATGYPGAGAEDLLGRGDMLYIEDGMSPRRVQVARGDSESIRDLLDLARAKRVPSTPRVLPADVLAPRVVSLSVRYTTLLREYQARTDGAIPPPLWLCGAATAHAMRHRAPMPHHKIRTLHKAREGADITLARRNIVRQVAAECAGLA